ncbi:MAG: Cof-type HAD-IIB family hydrolase [Eubacterium aggregans]|uniref:Cof-type HAD-IIB family hydrolase n=1 Tax=Eubacterium aggregans TaxID=81409 RepID=UPI002B1FC038|nr:Cof-type HAD-IIB family hydrolase [Eubacterium aggregans]MEA5072697.1 Cof-type HAD-IIB family hydrolase [Eubacterium aggregans]
MIKLLALDLDDTLLTSDKRVTEGNRQALLACLDQGIHVVTASGRFNESQLAFIRMINLGLEKNPHLGDGGGTIFNEDGILEIMGAFPRRIYAAVLKRIREIGLPCYVTNGENVYYDIAEQPLRSIYNQAKGARRDYIFPVDDLMAVENPMKFVFAFTSEEELARIQEIQQPGTINFSAGRNLREITMVDMNKLNGLKEIAKIYGVELSEIACFGDSENDIQMLEGAGLGFAVANAMENVKAAADIVGEKTNDEDGIAWLIERYIL